ncbi:MAG: hypothetical protein M3132_09415, partial [Actinomycetia bacterium]|nr:hypothetical protein [Actinomycetes bacterium]
TTDGSPETQRSLDSVGVPDSSADESSVSRPEPGMYVEWARAIALTGSDDVGHETVDVVFRTISLSDDGFIRDPVAAVSVEVVTGDETAGIFGPPVTIPVPDLGVPERDDPRPTGGPVSESP